MGLYLKFEADVCHNTCPYNKIMNCYLLAHSPPNLELILNIWVIMMILGFTLALIKSYKAFIDTKSWNRFLIKFIQYNLIFSTVIFVTCIAATLIYMWISNS